MQNSSPVLPLAYKNTSAKCVCPVNRTDRKKRLLTGCKVHAARLFLLFLAICRIRFLTLINNFSIFQRANPKNLRPVRFCCFGGFIGFSECKVIKSKPHIQIFCVKKYETLKNSCFLLKKPCKHIGVYAALFKRLLILYNKILKKYLVKSCKSLAY